MPVTYIYSQPLQDWEVYLFTLYNEETENYKSHSKSMSLKAIGCLTPKTQPFPISQIVKEGRICSFETIPSVLSLGLFSSVPWSCRSVSWEIVGRKLWLAFPLTFSTCPWMLCPLWGPFHESRRADTLIWSLLDSPVYRQTCEWCAGAVWL